MSLEILKIVVINSGFDLGTLEAGLTVLKKRLEILQGELASSSGIHTLLTVSLKHK